MFATHATITFHGKASTFQFNFATWQIYELSPVRIGKAANFCADEKQNSHNLYKYDVYSH